MSTAMSYRTSVVVSRGRDPDVEQYIYIYTINRIYTLEVEGERPLYVIATRELCH